MSVGDDLEGGRVAMAMVAVVVVVARNMSDGIDFDRKTLLSEIVIHSSFIYCLRRSSYVFFWV